MPATVSVVMATYNGERFIREQLDSILAQTYPIYEIIIQDDCSTDRTVDIINEYSLKSSTIKLEINERNLGFNENFQKGVMRSSGDYVALSDQDDVWLPDKIRLQIEAIGQKSMCYCFDFRGSDMDSSIILKPKCAPERQLFDVVYGHTMLLEGGFVRDPENWLNFVSFDYSLGINAHLKGGVTFVDKPLVFYRTHENEVSFSIKEVTHKAWYPYLKGYRLFRTMQKSTQFVKYFSTILERSEGKNELVHNLCRLMLGQDKASFLKLCLLCMRHYKTIYPRKGNILRGFFYPQIYASSSNWQMKYAIRAYVDKIPAKPGQKNCVIGFKL